MTEGNCVICTKERAAHIGYLCRGHLEKLGAILRDVEDQAAMLDARPSMEQRSGSGKGSLASERAPARLDVLALLDSRTYPYVPVAAGPACPHCWHGTCVAIRAWDNAVNARATDNMSVLDTLHGWARIVREDRALAAPERITVTGERDLLTRHLPWVAEQPWVDEAYSELRTLLGQLRGVNGTNELRKKPVGICPTLYDDGECGGRLWPDDTAGDVVCDACGRVFVPDELRHLGDMLIRQGYVEVFRAEWFTGVPAGTIRRWVSEGRCTSEKDGRKLMVRINEVEQLRNRTRRRSVAS